MKFARAAAALALCAACAGGKAERSGQKGSDSLIEVEDALHGVRFDLPPSEDGWQIAHEGASHVSGRVHVNVASFPLPRDASPATCRDVAQKQLSAVRQRNDEDDSASPASAQDVPQEPDVPRDQSTGDAPTATWSFTHGTPSSPERIRRAFYARGADCLVLQVSGPRDDKFVDQVFDDGARTLRVLPLPPERQREIDLLAGMGFLERREPAAALDRFEALTKREPNFAKAHFGALMAGFEIGPEAYARALPHGKEALKADHDLTPDQRQLALRAVGVMQLAENQVKDAADTLAELVVRAPDLAEGQYNYACALARMGDKSAALDHLRTAIRLDGDLAAHARTDDDLRSLREMPAFQSLVQLPSARAQ
jgi:hypothetical protein